MPSRAAWICCMGVLVFSPLVAGSCLDAVSGLNCSGFGVCVPDTSGTVADGIRCDCVPARFERSLVPSHTVNEPFCGLGLWDFPGSMKILYGLMVTIGAIELTVVSFLLRRIVKMKLLIVNLRCVALGFILIHALFQCLYHVFSFGSTFSREWELIFAASMDPWVSTAYNIVLLFWRKLAQRALQRPFSLKAMTVTALITLPIQIIVIFITAFERSLEFYLMIYIAYLTTFSLAFLLYTVRIKTMVAELNAMAAAAIAAAQAAKSGGAPSASSGGVGKPSPRLTAETSPPSPGGTAKKYEVAPGAANDDQGDTTNATNSVRSAWRSPENNTGVIGSINTVAGAATHTISIRAIQIKPAPGGGKRYNSVNEKVTRLATVNACICLVIVVIMAFWVAIQDNQGPQQYMWFYGIVRTLGVIWALAITWAFWEPPAGPTGAITVRVVAPGAAPAAVTGARLTSPQSQKQRLTTPPGAGGIAAAGAAPGATGSSVFGGGGSAAASYNGGTTASYVPSKAAAAGAAAASRPDASLAAVIALRQQEQAARDNNSYLPGQPSTLGSFGSSHSNVHGGGPSRLHTHHHHSMPTVQSSVNFQ